MDELWQELVRERAQAIWRREGSPAGSPDQFIAMAEQELISEGQRPMSNPVGDDDATTAAVDDGPVDDTGRMR